TASNRLTSVTQGATTLRAFTYDAAGNVTVDNRAGVAWNYTINNAGRLRLVRQGATTKGTYTYDGRQRLAIRVVANTTGANGTTHLIHGFPGCALPLANDHALIAPPDAKPGATFAGGAFACDKVLAETSGTGPASTIREYIWLGDMPVAVVDKTVTPNKTYAVHADHLNRPYLMTDAAKAVVWKAVYEPFGTVYSTTGAAAQNLRFPGQWFQIESNLAWNWHRHYDATLGRYISADPLNHALNGAPVTATTLRGGTTAPFSAKLAWLNQPALPDMLAITAPVALNRPQATQWLPDQAGSSGLLAVNAAQSIRGTGLFPDGPNLYAYARQAPGKNTDPTGLSIASGPMSVKPPTSIMEQCLQPNLPKDDCRELYFRCYEEKWTTAPGKRCENCLHRCQTYGQWPYNWCQ
ncbi:MAG: RHS repeat-associated core domain-containing protein, partial [Beijerinckiaceae bacterium]